MPKMPTLTPNPTQGEWASKPPTEHSGKLCVEFKPAKDMMGGKPLIRKKPQLGKR